MDHFYDMRHQVLMKDERIRDLEALIAEKDQLIEELKAKLDKFQVITVCIQFFPFLEF